MDEIQSYRMHPKMTKGLLDQIDNLQKTNHCYARHYAGGCRAWL